MDFELPDLPDAKVAQEQSRVQEEKLKETIIERMGYFILKVNNQIKQAIDSGKFCCTFSISGNEIYKILSQGNEAEYIMFNKFATSLYIVNLSMKKYYTDKGYSFSCCARDSYTGEIVDIKVGWR
mgnify:CR=1 FL=1